VNSEENHEVGVAASACADALADGPAGGYKPAGAPLRATARSVRASARFVRSSVLGGADARAPAVLSSGAACPTEVVAALRALPAQYSSVIVETFYRGRNVPETADVLGVSADMVKARCYDALHALKHALAERGLTA
jgi:DNA-directed RNA polymerase specialized sigma24 family protein